MVDNQIYEEEIGVYAHAQAAGLIDGNQIRASPNAVVFTPGGQVECRGNKVEP